MAQRTLHEFALPTLDVEQGSIERPKINANDFKIKTATIQMIWSTLLLKGNMVEDPNQHLKRFLQLCYTFKYNGVVDDVVHI